MNRRVLTAVVLVGLTIPSALACEGPPVCTVVDPTGTPLNVRTGPNDDIVGSLKNGMKIEVIEHQESDGNRWALVASSGKFGFTVSFTARYARATKMGVEIEGRARLIAPPRRLADGVRLRLSDGRIEAPGPARAHPRSALCQR